MSKFISAVLLASLFFFAVGTSFSPNIEWEGVPEANLVIHLVCGTVLFMLTFFIGGVMDLLLDRIESNNDQAHDQS